MSKFLAVLISFAVIASSWTSAAEAGPGRQLGFFLGGMAAASMMAQAAENRRREEAYERMRARRIAQERAEAIAAARRERARQIALQKQKAAQLAAAEASAPATATDNDQPALKKGDRLPSVQDDTASKTSTSGNTAEQTSSDDTAKTTSSTTPVSAQNPTSCRKYSAAADAVIDVPCE